MEKEEINVVWLKRDLRLQDNEAIHNAMSEDVRVLFLYVFELSLLKDPHYNDRHWNFIKQSIVDINSKLKIYNTKVLCVTTEVVNAFNQLQEHFNINTVFSHQETGLLVTYNRDKDFARYCRNNSIKWVENNNNGVLRGLSDREDWFDYWEDFMNKPVVKNTYKADKLISEEEISLLERGYYVTSLETKESRVFQQGGTSMAWKYANSFFKDRHKNYMYNISKPAKARESNSRLSPYLAWGNISVRQVYQTALNYINDNNKRHLGAFISRLRWQAHFIQKFEMEHTMEEESINKGYRKLKKSISDRYQKAWREGNTGFPLIDASMRCLNTTGYLNFRMRSMLVSFFTHILWQPWQDSSQHLSQMFLDFEPGIHFPQLQMQAGETGINDIRIYNPVKNSLEHDSDAEFIKKWVPELAGLPLRFVHEPQLMTPLEEQFNDFKLGDNYPKPIVALKTSRKKALDILWAMKNDPDVLIENKRILSKHTISDRKRLLQNEQINKKKKS